MRTAQNATPATESANTVHNLNTTLPVFPNTLTVEANTAAYTNDTYQATIQQLQAAISNAPTNPGRIAANLLGWWTADGVYICSTCAGRIIARGCQLPHNVEPVWTGQPYGTCCTCGK